MDDRIQVDDRVVVCSAEGARNDDEVGNPVVLLRYEDKFPRVK